MFDIAFSELVVIALVALIVIGPERLPKVARTAGHLWGRVQRYVNGVKNDIAHDMAIEEARKLHSNLQQDVAAAGKIVQETGLTLEQSILQAQYKKAPGTPPSPQSPSLPDKSE
jgi:sec-independent protein translocase protein TatB